MDNQVKVNAEMRHFLLHTMKMLKQMFFFTKVKHKLYTHAKTSNKCSCSIIGQQKSCFIFSLPFHEKCVHGIIICDASFFIVCSNVHDYENKPYISYGVIYPTEMLFYVKDFG